MFSGGATSMGVNTGFPFDPDNLVLVALWRKPAVRPLRSLGRHTNIDRRLLECSLGCFRVRFRGTGPRMPLHQLGQYQCRRELLHLGLLAIAQGGEPERRAGPPET